MVFEARLRSQTPISQSELRPRCARAGQFLVGNLVEPGDVPAVLPAQLRQPDVGALGNQHRGGHPGRVRRELLVFVSRIAEDRHLGAGDQWPLRPACVAPPLRPPAAGGLNCIQMASSSSRRISPAISSKRSRLSPSSGFQSLRIRASWSLSERGAPTAGARSSSSRFIGLASGSGISGRVAKYSGNCPRHLAVNGLFRQRLFLEKLLERPESLVAVGGPQQQQLFERGGAMRHSTRSRRQPLARRLHAPNHAELPGNCSTKASSIASSSSAPTSAEKTVQRGAHHLGIELLAVARHQDVAGLVDQPHGIKLAGVNRQLGMLFHVAHLVHAVGKLAAGGHIGKNHVSCVGKKRLREPVAFTRFPRNMEFHHGQPNSRWTI